MVPCSVVEGCHHFSWVCCLHLPVLWNAGTLVPNHKTLYVTGLYSWWWPPTELELSQRNWLMPCIELTTCRMCNFWNIVESCVGPELQNLNLYIKHTLWNLRTKIASCCSYSQNSCVFLFGPFIWLIQLYFLWLATCYYNHLLFTAVFWYCQAL
jgi:hypothetical protein